MTIPAKVSYSSPRLSSFAVCCVFVPPLRVLSVLVFSCMPSFDNGSFSDRFSPSLFLPPRVSGWVCFCSCPRWSLSPSVLIPIRSYLLDTLVLSHVLCVDVFASACACPLLCFSPHIPSVLVCTAACMCTLSFCSR